MTAFRLKLWGCVGQRSTLAIRALSRRSYTSDPLWALVLRDQKPVPRAIRVRSVPRGLLPILAGPNLIELRKLGQSTRTRIEARDGVVSLEGETEAVVEAAAAQLDQRMVRLRLILRVVRIGVAVAAAVTVPPGVSLEVPAEGLEAKVTVWGETAADVDRTLHTVTADVALLNATAVTISLPARLKAPVQHFFTLHHGSEARAGRGGVTPVFESDAIRLYGRTPEAVSHVRRVLEGVIRYCKVHSTTLKAPLAHLQKALGVTSPGPVPCDATARIYRVVEGEGVTLFGEALAEPKLELQATLDRIRLFHDTTDMVSQTVVVPAPVRAAFFGTFGDFVRSLRATLGVVCSTVEDTSARTLSLSGTPPNLARAVTTVNERIAVLTANLCEILVPQFMLLLVIGPGGRGIAALRVGDTHVDTGLPPKPAHTPLNRAARQTVRVTGPSSLDVQQTLVALKARLARLRHSTEVVTVPEPFMGLMVGVGGAALAEIRKATGATVLRGEGFLLVMGGTATAAAVVRDRLETLRATTHAVRVPVLLSNAFFRGPLPLIESISLVSRARISHYYPPSANPRRYDSTKHAGAVNYFMVLNSIAVGMIASRLETLARLTKSVPVTLRVWLVLLANPHALLGPLEEVSNTTLVVDRGAPLVVILGEDALAVKRAEVLVKGFKKQSV